MRSPGIGRGLGSVPISRGRLWQAIRFMRSFALEDVCSVTGIAYSVAHRFVWELRHSGYVKRIKKANPSLTGDCDLYRLIRNTGPEPPKLQGRGQLYDQNTGAVYAIEGRLTDRDKAWAEIRQLQEFTVELLVSRCGIGRKNCQKYVTGLLRAGLIVAIWEPRIEANGYGVYRVAEDAPVVTPKQNRDGSVDVPIMSGWLPGDAVLQAGTAVLPEQNYLPSDALIPGHAPDIDQALAVAQLIPEPVVDLDAIVEAPKPRPRKPRTDLGNRVPTELECQIVGWMRVNGALAIQQFDEIGGGWNPGSIYRALRRLIKRGVVRLEGTHHKQVYHLLEG